MRQPKQFHDTPGSLLEKTYQVRLVFFDPKTNTVHNDSYPEYDPWWAVNTMRKAWRRGSMRRMEWILFNGESYHIIRLWEDGLYHLARSSGRLWRLTLRDKKHLQEAVAKYLEEQLDEPIYHAKIVCRI